MRMPSALPLPPLTSAAPADVTLSSWFLEEDDVGGVAGASGPGPAGSLALILLNHTLPALTPALFRRAALVVCADGGANRLHAAAPAWAPGLEPDAARRAFLPSAIVGDLDSLAPATASFYAAAGVPIHGAPADQDTTDLEKSLAHVRQWMQGRGGGGAGAAGADAPTPPPPPPLVVVAAGALGGRLDHTLAAINALFKADGDALPLSLVLLGDGNLARALPARGRVALEPAACEGPACGVVALGGAVAGARSAGLAWDLTPATPPLALGGLQSTSNAVVGVGGGGRARAVVEIGEGGEVGGGRLLWVSEVRGGG